jgi:proteasome inhibitor subunit 1 (PI31)
LRYTVNKDIYILHGIVSGETLLVNILEGKTLKTATVVLKTKEIVKSKTGVTFNDYVSDSQPVIDQISKDIIKPILAQPPSAEDNPQSRSTSVDPLMIGPPRIPGPPMYYDPRRDPFGDPFGGGLGGVGRGDLDPFGRGGGSIFRPDLRHRPGPFNPIAPDG